MITEQREEAVLAEVEKLYLEHGETSQYYSLATRYEDVKQFAEQVEEELLFTISIDRDGSKGVQSDEFIDLNRKHKDLRNLVADLKKIVVKHQPEYFDWLSITLSLTCL